jgi:hypothetical protein
LDFSESRDDKYGHSTFLYDLRNKKWQLKEKWSHPFSFVGGHRQNSTIPRRRLMSM